MNPFFFGPSSQPLFGVHHPPNSTAGRGAGVLLCYPMGQEYMRAHRAFRQLALLLSRAGFHVMRFDYFGTGDSAGDGEEATVEKWIENIGSALDELKETADLEQLAIVGLRVGATLGACAASGRTDVSHLVMWDPILSGDEYLEEVLADHTGESVSRTAERSIRSGEETLGIMGFPMPPELRHGIERLHLKDVLPGSGSELLIVVSSESDEQKLQALAEHLNEATLLCVPSTGNWNEVDNFGSALIPQAIIREIVRHLSEKVSA